MVAAILLFAGAFAAILAYGSCPNKKADSRSQTQCRTCSDWTSHDNNQTCVFSDTDSVTIYGSCWDDSAKLHKAVLIDPPVHVNGILLIKHGTCDDGVCACPQNWNDTTYSADQMTTEACDPA